MDYVEVKFFSDDDIALDILVSDLADIGFESFEYEKDCLKAYIPFKLFNETKLSKLLLTSNYGQQINNHEIKLIPATNWNALWESAFEPIEIDGQLLILAPFHHTETHHATKIIINPQMSFGTGHHATTRLMCSCMLNLDFTRKKVLDMGCGTGILSILAKKLGAQQVDAVDHEQWAVENASENAALNNVEINSFHGQSGQWLNNNVQYDVILANINRNIIIRDLANYIKMLDKDGQILLSGFLITDEINLTKALEQQKLKIIEKKSDGEWLMIRAGLISAHI